MLDDKLNQMLRSGKSSSSRVSPIPGTGGMSGSPPNLTRSLRLDCPHFDRSDAVGWVFKVEQFFNYYRIDYSQRLTVTSFPIDGDAPQWYKWMASNHLLGTWSDFTTALKTHFAPLEFENSHGSFAKLTQQGSIAKYQSAFEAFANRTTNLPSDFLVHCFILGLRPDIKHEVLAFRPTSMVSAIRLARLQETKLEAKHQTLPRGPL